MSSVTSCKSCGAPVESNARVALCRECFQRAELERTSDAGIGRPIALTPAAKAVDSATDAHRDARTQVFSGPSDPGREARSGDFDSKAQLGEYRLIRKLGQGGMGTVYEAEEIQNGRRVALKLLDHALSDQARSRFFREGRLAASINHPHCVYVYGTEEIDGTPAISMEYIAGGTLSDRVSREGPLPGAKAVDIILQIVDGLEAAARVGVLHRDIKPSNCFVDTDGTVKVGDFGLSVLTTARTDSQLTQQGAFLGTPAYCSPEQLRGEELDVRSDIHSVGVTLYFLLTGRLPFEGDNLVILVGQVLTQAAPSPTSIRREIPQGLSRVVMRCLEKRPDDRYADYAELRSALAPFDSSASTPATLALRTAAGICDGLLLTLFSSIAVFSEFVISGPREFISIAVTFVYFTLSEGIFGASPGKALFRLRVVQNDRSPVGLVRAAGRTALYMTLRNVILWPYKIYLVASGQLQFADWGAREWGLFSLASVSDYLMLAVMFSLARRSNGYAGLHDLATKTRVILRPTNVERPALEAKESPQPTGEVTDRIGPYQLYEQTKSIGGQTVELAFDPRLLRLVWVHKVPVGTSPVPAARQEVSRIARLRWINGRRSAEQSWDAYEALSGKPLVALLSETQLWGAVRHWLLDLAEELDAATNDGTLPRRVGLDHVWITADGRAELVDVACESNDGNSISSQRLLYDLAARALCGSADEVNQSKLERIATRLPVGANAVLKQLAADAPLDEIVPAMRSLLERPPEVTRSRRVAILAATLAVPLFAALLGMAGQFAASRMSGQQPMLVRLQDTINCMERRQATVNVRTGGLKTEAWNNDRPAETALEDDKARREAFEIYIAGTFRDLVRDPATWNAVSPYAASVVAVTPRMRALAEKIIAERPPPSAEELKNAAAVVEPLLEEHRSRRSYDLARIGANLLLPLLMWIILITVPSLLAAVLFRRGLLVRAFGVDYVTCRATLARRWRMLFRTVLVNLPVVVAIIVMFPLLRMIPDWRAGAIVYSALLALVVCSSLLPDRGLADRLAGTYPVPR